MITLKLVKDVFNEELSIIHPMIRALQSGRKEEILKYADLDLPADTIRIIGQTGDKQLGEPEDVDEISTDKCVELTDMLIRMGLGDDVAKLAAQKAIDEKPNEDLFGLVAHIKSLEDKSFSESKPTKPQVTKLEPNYVDNDLRLFRSDEPMSTYHHLKSEGMILDITPYL